MGLSSRDFVDGDYQRYIRPLTKENMEKLFIDNFGGWSDLVSEQKFFNIVKEGFVRLFFLEDTFIGYISFGSEEEDKNSYLIHDMHIEKKFQRQGFGTEILNVTINQVKELGGIRLKAFVFKKNTSINFYTKKGFREINYLEKSDTSIMVKKIRQT